MGAIFKYLLYFGLGYIIYRFFTRLFRPAPSGRATNSHSNSNQARPNQGTSNGANHNHGNKATKQFTGGEYIDFEEIEDKGKQPGMEED